jgi:hypothetical protein
MNFSDSDEEGDSASKQVKVVLLGNSATGKVREYRNLQQSGPPQCQCQFHLVAERGALMLNSKVWPIVFVLKAFLTFDIVK